jgi:serine/threonine-protein kinase RsbW
MSQPGTPPAGTGFGDPPSRPVLRLILPARPEHLPALLALAEAVAQAGGLAGPECQSLLQALEQAGRAALAQAAQSAESQELELVLEPGPGQLALVLRDQGPPLHWAGPDLGQGAGLEGLDQLVDQVAWRNLGPRGNELRLVKRWSAGGEAQAGDMIEVPPPEAPLPEPLGLRVELMRPGQAREVARCVWSAYGYTYVDPDLYYPERLEQLNREGRLISAVASDQDGRLLGHAALSLEPEHGGRAEMGKAFVDPGYRQHGLLGELSRFLLARADALGLPAVTVQAVTGHTLSQQAAASLGFVDCALRLAAAPRPHFRQLPTERQRLSLVLACRLARPPQTRPPLPLRHGAMLHQIYDALGVGPVSAPPPDGQPPAGCGQLEVRRAPGWQGAEIGVWELGGGSGRELERLWRQLKLERPEAILLSLPLGRPGLEGLLERAEDLGFFFCGLDPAAPGGDRLLLQYLNNLALDYDHVRVLSDLGQRIKAYVQGLDPNQAASEPGACSLE